LKLKSERKGKEVGVVEVEVEEDDVDEGSGRSEERRGEREISIQVCL